MDDYSGVIYAAMGATFALVSHYIFGWPAWVAILTGVFGPAIISTIFLIGFLWYWGRVGD